MTEPTHIADARPARIAVALPVAGTPGTGAPAVGARARVRRAGRAGTIRLLPLRAGEAWPRRTA